MTTSTDLVAAVAHAATVLPAMGAAVPVLAILLTALFAIVLVGRVFR